MSTSRSLTSVWNSFYHWKPFFENPGYMPLYMCVCMCACIIRMYSLCVCCVCVCVCLCRCVSVSVCYFFQLSEDKRLNTYYICNYICYLLFCMDCFHVLHHACAYVCIHFVPCFLWLTSIVYIWQIIFILLWSHSNVGNVKT